MLEKPGSQAKPSSEYPYESIYRPWSWILSSSINLFLFAAVVCLAYMLYKSRRAKGKRRQLTYRVVEVNKPLLESEEPARINALVTGGSGRLGREIVSCLLKDGGYKVHSLDLFIPEEGNRNSEVCSYIQADIANYDDLCIALKGMDVVFHTAAIIPTVFGVSDRDYDEVNWKGTENVIAACKERKVKRLIYTSTADVTLGKDRLGAEVVDEDYPIPKDCPNAYVRTKREAEKAVLAANDREGLRTCAVRPGGILEMMTRSKLDHLTY
jgi:nucleoside-diphosphate-sugar epimerase